MSESDDSKPADETQAQILPRPAYPKTYLGDAVYVQFDGYYGLTLTTENGIRTTNEIYLEGPVYEALVAYVKSLREGR